MRLTNCRVYDAFMLTVMQRIERRTQRDPDDGCWHWTGATLQGYGAITITEPGSKKVKKVHRVAYEELRGPIPDGLTIDHLCRTRDCWRPDHLEVVTHRVNILRSTGPAAINAAKETCKNGHPLDSLDYEGYRACSVCTKAKWKRSNEARRARRAATSQLPGVAPLATVGTVVVTVAN